jgi:hypothetical protein
MKFLLSLELGHDRCWLPLKAAVRGPELTNPRVHGKTISLLFLYCGLVVELVDALDSKSSVRKDVRVRVSPEPPLRSLRALPFAVIRPLGRMNLDRFLPALCCFAGIALTVASGSALVYILDSDER